MGVGDLVGNGSGQILVLVLVQQMEVLQPGLLLEETQEIGSAAHGLRLRHFGGLGSADSRPGARGDPPNLPVIFSGYFWLLQGRRLWTAYDSGNSVCCHPLASEVAFCIV